MSANRQLAWKLAKECHQDAICKFLEGQADSHAKETLSRDLLLADKEYPGGLNNYLKKITKLMCEYVENKTKYDDCILRPPNTYSLSWDEQETIRHTDKVGTPELKKLAFFLLGGGLGERLGYNGAKPNMFIESVIQQSYLCLYCEYVKEYQRLSGPPGVVTLPFIIMVTEETEKHLRKVLEEKQYYGLKADQFHFLRQNMVPAVINIKGEIDFDPMTGRMNTKPHGHGESHLLMYKSGLARQLKEQGFEWIVFFNDTNPLAFRFLPSFLGIGKENNLDTLYVCVKRIPGEAVGAICHVNLDGKDLITNVEYNVLEKLGQKHPEPVDQDGYSKLPGNVNFIIISLKTYDQTLAASQGFVPEFINPKFEADGYRLKAPTRMETLISEYTFLLNDSKHVGAVQCERLMCFTCAKNENSLGQQRQAKHLSTETCGACQFDFYHHNQTLLEKLGVKFEPGKENYVLDGIKYEVGPRVILNPSFGATFAALEEAVGKNVRISSRSYLELEGKVNLEDFELDGSCRVSNKTPQTVTLAGKSCKTGEYVTFAPIHTTEMMSYDDKIRGFVTHGVNKIQTIHGTKLAPKEE